MYVSNWSSPLMPIHTVQTPQWDSHFASYGSGYIYIYIYIYIYRTLYIYIINYYYVLYIYSIINKLTHLKHLQPFLEIVIPFTTHHPMFPRSSMAVTSSKLFRCANASQRSCARCSSCARRGTESESFAPAAPMALARMELAGRRPLLGNPMNYPIIRSRYYVGWSYWIIG